MYKSISIIFILGTISSLFYCHSLIIDFDSLQLYTRGIALAKYGILIPVGSLATKAGFIPGPLLAIITGLSFKIYTSVFSISYGILFLHILSFFLIFKSIKEQFDSLYIVLFLIMYWLSPWRAAEVFPWNPSYLFFISSLNFYLLVKHHKNKKLISFFIPVILGLTVQIHKSILVYFFSYLFLFIKKSIKIDWKYLILGSLITLVTFIPFFLIEITPQALSIEQNQDKAYYFRNLVRVGPVIKGMLYWVRYSSLWTSVDVFKSIDFAWTGLSSFLHSIKWLIAISSILLSVACNYFLWKKRDYIDHSLLMIIYSMFFATFCVSAISPVSFNYWHLFLIYPFSILAMVKGLSVSPLQLKKPILVILIFYSFSYNYLASVKSYKHDSSKNPQIKFDKYRENNEFKKRACRVVHCP